MDYNFTRQIQRHYFPDGPAGSGSVAVTVPSTQRWYVRSAYFQISNGASGSAKENGRPAVRVVDSLNRTTYYILANGNNGSGTGSVSDVTFNEYSPSATITGGTATGFHTKLGGIVGAVCLPGDTLYLELQQLNDPVTAFDSTLVIQNGVIEFIAVDEPKA